MLKKQIKKKWNVYYLGYEVCEEQTVKWNRKTIEGSFFSLMLIYLLILSVNYEIEKAIWRYLLQYLFSFDVKRLHIAHANIFEA